MTDTNISPEAVQIRVSQSLPNVSRQRFIWQPVTVKDGLQMQLAPLDWQPSGAHHALQYLVDQVDALSAALTKSRAETAAYERAHDALPSVGVTVKPLEWEPSVDGWEVAYGWGFIYSVGPGEDKSQKEHRHRARILSAIDVQIAPAPSPDVALVMAAEQMLDAFCVHEDSHQIAAYEAMCSALAAIARKGGDV